MKVVLIQDLKGVGQKNTVLDVSDGYARNYLIRRGFARSADPGTLKMLRDRGNAVKTRAEAKKREVEEYIAKLRSVEIQIERKANSKGVLFEAVDARHILPYFHKRGFKLINEKNILIEPLKNIGKHKVIIELDGENIPVSITINEKN